MLIQTISINFKWSKTLYTDALSHAYSTLNNLVQAIYQLGREYGLENYSNPTIETTRVGKKEGCTTAFLA